MRATAFRLLWVLTVLIAAGPLLADEMLNRARASLRDMKSVARAIQAYTIDHNQAPDATSLEALAPLLESAYIRDLPLRDAWGTPLRYVRAGPRSFRIISAGSDERFDEKSWDVRTATRDLSEDAVYAATSDRGSGDFERIWTLESGAPLAITEREAEARARPLVEAELEKMKDMTPEQSFSYLRTESTQWMMSHLAAALEAYRSKRGRYPAAGSIGEVESALFPEFISEVPKIDRWATELRYVVSRDGKSYRLISAGSDTMFDETSWAKPGSLASSDDDAVVENGRPVRVWTTETQPGLGVLAKLRPEARARLAEADRRLDADDNAGALEAYIQGVELDPAAADLERINRYAPMPYSVLLAPPPPPPPPPPAARSAPSTPPPPAPMPAEDMEGRAEKARSAHITALRQYLRIHPGGRDAITSLAMLLPAKESDTLMSELVQRSPEDPAVYEARAQVRSRAGRLMEALGDFEMASRLDADNPERFYLLGVVAYEAATKQTGLNETQKRALIARGLAAVERAGSLRADYFEALMYRSLLLREQANLEKDPAESQKLIDQADALRQKALDLANARRAKP